MFDNIPSTTKHTEVLLFKLNKQIVKGCVGYVFQAQIKNHSGQF